VLAEAEFLKHKRSGVTRVVGLKPLPQHHP
jgi:hypothetical protein